ncbi:MAG: glucuronate isomerase [Verrucomicrobiota bacterium]|nr:glucuronate isomerase [Limisphaera sp.]MDW8381665.1 glucuronate isomerase [Verrucomicrobiota bacterium]
MKGFIHDDFLLTTRTARRLYHEYAEQEPILDFHCHLPPRDLAENRRFQNLFEIWLEGDHYKWRAMRSNGVEERYCTGDAPPYEKFLAWARTVPYTLRNPLYHWTHLELKRYFGINLLLNEQTAPKIWQRANERLAGTQLSAHGILQKFRVQLVGTTDDPADDLRYHAALAQSRLPFKVIPTFRPDKALQIQQPDVWNSWLDRLAAAANVDIGTWDDLLLALERRHEAFGRLGARASDHGLETAFATFSSEARLRAIFRKARRGKMVTPEERDAFATHVMLHVARLNAAKGWVMQLHLGALRNNNTRRFRELGPDTGFDSIGDFPQARSLAAFLDRLDQDDALPRTILYNLNPADNYVFGTMLGNFMDGRVAGKIQLGPAWWFLDQKEGMEWQLNALSNLGLLSRFVGMVTDSRSFMSYPRHEYYRRVLCNLIGRDVELGEIPNDPSLLGPLIRNLCYGNARTYFGFDEILGSSSFESRPPDKHRISTHNSDAALASGGPPPAAA